MKTKCNLDGAHSGVNFAVRHMVVSKVRARFAAFVGMLELDDADLTQSTVDVTIEASSIDTGTAKRDDHLRSVDFFDADKFPTLRYRSKRVEKLGMAQFRMIGDLTIRDVTREVALDVAYGGRGKDPWATSALASPRAPPSTAKTLVSSGTRSSRRAECSSARRSRSSSPSKP
jgi:polyisoprenoid-binding protein YceI